MSWAVGVGGVEEGRALEETQCGARSLSPAGGKMLSWGGEEREDKEKMAEAFSVGRVESKHLLNLEAAVVSGQCRPVGWNLVHWAFAESVDPGGPQSSQENTEESHPSSRTFERVLGSLRITRRGPHPLSSLYPIWSSKFPAQGTECLFASAGWHSWTESPHRLVLP